MDKERFLMIFHNNHKKIILLLWIFIICSFGWEDMLINSSQTSHWMWFTIMLCKRTTINMVKFHALIVYTPLTQKKYLLFPTNITINFVAFYRICTLFGKQYIFPQYSQRGLFCCYALLLYVPLTRKKC